MGRARGPVTKELPILTPKQQAWVESFAKHGNATRAAAEAGYGGGYQALAAAGSRMLKNVKVKAHLAAAVSSAAQRLEITKEQVLLWLDEIRSRCMTPGEEYNPQPAIRATELIGKELGMFVERSENTTTVAFAKVPEVAASDEAWAAQFKAQADKRQRMQ